MVRPIVASSVGAAYPLKAAGGYLERLFFRLLVPESVGEVGWLAAFVESVVAAGGVGELLVAVGVADGPLENSVAVVGKLPSAVHSR